MPTPAKSRYALLGALSIGPMSGYDIKQLFERSIGHFWHESYGQIYPMLRQLAAEGLVLQSTEQQSGRPERHVYALTEAGWAALRAWVAAPVEEYGRPRSELLLKLFFSRHAPPALAREHLLRYRELQQAALARLGALEAELRSADRHDPNLTYWLITLRHGVHAGQALIAWCDEALAMLEESNAG
jgi:DNA-binding PadR family transcriptional regulator